MINHNNENVKKENLFRTHQQLRSIHVLKLLLSGRQHLIGVGTLRADLFLRGPLRFTITLSTFHSPPAPLPPLSSISLCSYSCLFWSRGFRLFLGFMFRKFTRRPTVWLRLLYDKGQRKGECIVTKCAELLKNSRGVSFDEQHTVFVFPALFWICTRLQQGHSPQLGA